VKTRLLPIGGALLLAFAANPVVAESLTVNMTAHVDYLYDPDNVLGGQISIGQFAKGSYAYETTVPNYWAPYQATNSYGEYAQDRTQGRLSFSVAPFAFESDATSWSWTATLPNAASFDIRVQGNPSYTPAPGHQTYFQMYSVVNKPLANGASVSNLYVYLSEMNGSALLSGDLPTGAPNLAAFTDRTAMVSGQTASGSWYLVQLKIDSMAVAPVLQVSPSNSTFVRQQRIDPAVLVTGNGQVSGVRASINGAPLPPEYSAQCQLTPPNSQNRPAATCPNIVPLLLPGPNHVEWNADLADGSTATSAADWEVIE